MVPQSGNNSAGHGEKIRSLWLVAAQCMFDVLEKPPSQLKARDLHRVKFAYQQEPCLQRYDTGMADDMLEKSLGFGDASVRIDEIM